MHVITARNVNDALLKGSNLIIANSNVISPRGRATLEVPGPVATEYLLPWERVVFSRARDANPFLHLFEALWMLAGRRDVEFMSFLSKRMLQFSDDGKVMQGSYGWRWREFFGFDQLKEIIGLLRKDRDSRRAVLTMWSAPGDLLDPTSTDIPCNTQVYFKIRNDRLNMTVCNRSNDMLWGAYGANVVHMSILQEYIAEKLGILAGAYHQISDSFHVYLDGPGGEVWERISGQESDVGRDLYLTEGVGSVPMGMDSPKWDEDLQLFFQCFDEFQDKVLHVPFQTPWWEYTAKPMWNAYVRRDGFMAQRIAAKDWRIACVEWLERRAK